ncbi:site-specific integrase [Aquimarina mytili]|uniref:Site-specific integrase n=1 Tax=Aquimarina mytili TaxID=874423 RepID=A0A936ZSN3_9FLAO|nr:site-specific integrase [Aquimarina mytili]MBL0683572.1 site-specific integrase [Aquimarina mytili]
MSTTKLILFKGKKKVDGKYLLTLRVTHDRKPSYLFFEWVNEKDWDQTQMRVKKSHPNSQRLNHHILKKLTEANDTILEYETKKKPYTSSDIVNLLRGGQKDGSFFKIAEEYIDELTAQGKINRAKPDSSRIKLFKEFLKGRDIQFYEINEPLLKKLKTFILSKNGKGKGSGERSVMNTFVVIRTLFNRAITEGVADQKDYPFGKGKIQIKFPETVKIGLDQNEIAKIENLDLEEHSPIWHTRNVFLFSFYLAGIRISDVLNMKWSDIQKGRIIYKMNKNSKVDSLKLSEKVKDILKYYAPNKKKEDDFIFPELKKANSKDPGDINAKIRTAVKKFNKYLDRIREKAEIHKKITTHIARHSFGNIAGDRISPQMLQKLYRHSHLSTTIGYQGNFIYRDTDEALDSVINF